MAMQVGDGFTCVRPIIEDQPEAGLAEPELARYFAGLEQQMPEDLVVLGFGIRDARNGSFRNHQHMHGCLRLDIAEGKHLVVLIDNRRWNFPGDNLLEQGLAHGQENVAPNPCRQLSAAEQSLASQQLNHFVVNAEQQQRRSPLTDEQGLVISLLQLEDE